MSVVDTTNNEEIQAALQEPRLRFEKDLKTGFLGVLLYRTMAEQLASLLPTEGERKTFIWSRKIYDPVVLTGHMIDDLQTGAALGIVKAYLTVDIIAVQVLLSIPWGSRGAEIVLFPLCNDQRVRESFRAKLRNNINTLTFPTSYVELGDVSYRIWVSSQ